MWQRIWVRAWGPRGQGARTPEMERVAKSSCTRLRAEECLFKRQAVELVTEGLAAAEWGSPFSLVLSLYLRVFALGRREGPAQGWQGIDRLQLRNCANVKQKIRDHGQKKVNKKLLKKTLTAKDTLCAHCCCPLFSFLSQVLHCDNTQGLFCWPAVSHLNSSLS